MTAPSGPPSREAAEHAQLVLNAIAQFEGLLRPLFESRAPDERSELSRAMIKWLADAPDAMLRAALLDQPCPADFFEKWISPEQIRMWQAGFPARGCVHEGGKVCIRPTDLAKVLQSVRTG